MQVRWLTTALQNLNQEVDYIAQDDPQAARLVVQRIHKTVSLLTDNPAFGHPGRMHGTRELVVPDTRYILPYRVRPRLDRIEILREFHSSRKTPRSWTV
ncbi:type II toxin-antitoxin system RelE/ParE family toxin [Haliea sp. E1-2-M8]|uniref:type II toxin-antitoxin system RelE/ParE family toxin n=1 Tax=Haliea sp. E1-2-M8 TaxID=3064706 RepID=UPI00272014AD|nr:type II toxin-antitoxin system RelE/ParE family toxin [Haliea sp. E1-2-M8]MDO8864065.1 type II toxin-antitoxin system RelE/ParE family toxin [Haliea sp. E1-2-M8]